MTEVAETIKKLIAKSSDSAASSAEAEACLMMAQRLATQHAIDLAKIMTPETARIGVLTIGRVNGSNAWHVRTMTAVTKLYPLRAWTSGDELTVAGREEYLDASKSTFEFINRQVEAEYRESLPRGLSTGERARFRRTFKMACATRIFERADARLSLITSDDGEAQREFGSTALVVRDSIDDLLREASEFMTNDLGLKLVFRRRRHKPGVGTRSGYEAGNRVSLRPELAR